MNIFTAVYLCLHYLYLLPQITKTIFFNHKSQITQSHNHTYIHPKLELVLTYWEGRASVATETTSAMGWEI